MPGSSRNIKILFIINPGSGDHEIDLKELISNYFEGSPHEAILYEMPSPCSIKEIRETIKNSKPASVVAVGGDGTLKLVAECLLDTGIPVGILPAGSANGMARELGIPSDLHDALDVVIRGNTQTIHAVQVNGELCIHLSDIGFNAYLVKKFDDLPQRGMWGYAKAAWKALWNHHKMHVQLKLKDETISANAAMVVIANATMYGTGVKINPEGNLNDDLFEVILIKSYSVLEILKIRFTDLPFNPEKIEIFQTRDLVIKTRHKVHFQVDGEYLGKVNRVEATLVPEAIRVIV